MKIYTTWGDLDDEFPTTFIEGIGPPKYANGEVCEDSTKKFYDIHAKDWNEAMKIYHERQGWEPYKPFFENGLNLN
jgi:hypothetical protein